MILCYLIVNVTTLLIFVTLSLISAIKVKFSFNPVASFTIICILIILAMRTGIAISMNVEIKNESDYTGATIFEPLNLMCGQIFTFILYYFIFDMYPLKIKI